MTRERRAPVGARRVARAEGWTEAKRRLFLDRLATCATVKTACEATGMDIGGLYHLRRRDADFAAQWEEALAAGYATIEAMLLKRAAEALEASDPETMDTELAKWLLSLRGRRAGPTPDNPRRLKIVDPKALNEAILAKLDALEQREREKRTRAGKRPKRAAAPAAAGGGGS